MTRDLTAAPVLEVSFKNTVFPQAVIWKLAVTTTWNPVFYNRALILKDVAFFMDFIPLFY